MTAARLYHPGEPLRIEQIPRPDLGPPTPSSGGSGRDLRLRHPHRHRGHHPHPATDRSRWATKSPAPSTGVGSAVRLGDRRSGRGQRLGHRRHLRTVPHRAQRDLPDPHGDRHPHRRRPGRLRRRPGTQPLPATRQRAFPVGAITTDAVATPFHALRDVAHLTAGEVARRHRHRRPRPARRPDRPVARRAPDHRHRHPPGQGKRARTLGADITVNPHRAARRGGARRHRRPRRRCRRRIRRLPDTITSRWRCCGSAGALSSPASAPTRSPCSHPCSSSADSCGCSAPTASPAHHQHRAATGQCGPPRPEQLHHPQLPARRGRHRAAHPPPEDRRPAARRHRQGPGLCAAMRIPVGPRRRSRHDRGFHAPSGPTKVFPCVSAGRVRELRRGAAAVARGRQRHRPRRADRRPAARRAAREGPRADGGRHRRGAAAGPVAAVPAGHRGRGDRGGGPPGRPDPARSWLRGPHRGRQALGRHRAGRPQQRVQPDPAARRGSPHCSACRWWPGERCSACCTSAR